MFDARDVMFLVQTGLEVAADVKTWLDKKEEQNSKTAENHLQSQSQEDR